MGGERGLGREGVGKGEGVGEGGWGEDMRGRGGRETIEIGSGKK